MAFLPLRLKKEGFFSTISQMELTYVTIVVLASMIFILSGMVGYLYWQQTRLLQHLQSLAMALAVHIENTQEVAPPPEPEPQHVEDEEDEEEEDDRVSVKETVEVVEGPPKVSEVEVDIDGLQDKTSSQLRDMLTKKGIPFGKRDSKSLLIQLLKATA
jgi:hypothetical protein